MKNKIVILLCLILFIVSVAGVSAADDVNQTLTSDADDLISSEDTLIVSQSDDELIGSADDGTFTALQNKINDATENSTINLENDYAYDSGFSTGGITINKVLTINGNGHVIDALGQSRIFYINSPTITLNDITFKNGYCNQGGAIYFNHEIHDSSISGTFINNTVNDDAGAIFFSGSVSNCNISGRFINSYSNDDGAIFYFYNPVSNCSISGEYINNRGNYWGALFFRTIVDNTTLSGVFINNTARFSNGIDFHNGASNSRIINSVILNTGISNGNDVIMDNIWYGNTASNYDTKYSNLESWLFIDGSSSPVTGSSGKYAVVFDLNNLYNSSSKLVTHPDVSDFFDFDLELSASNGYLNKNTAKLGETVTFTSTINKDGVVTATVGDISYSIPIVNLNVDAPDVNKYYNGTERFVVTLTDNSNNPVANTEVSVTVDGETTEGLSDSNGQFSMPLDLNPGNYTVTTTAKGLKVFSTVQVYSTIVSSDVAGIYKKTKFEATILDSTGKPASNREVKFNIEGQELTGTTNSKGVVRVNINLDVGNYQITTINPVTGQIETNNVAISKANSTIRISSETFRNGATLTANINPTGLSGVVDFTINGNTYYTEDVNNSKASITLINLVAGSYSVVAHYSGDINHFESSTSSTFRVTKVVPNITVSADDISLGQNLVVNVVLPSDVEYRVNVSVGGMYKMVSLTNGVGSATFKGLAAGNYRVTAAYAGDSNYAKSSASKTVKVNRLIPKFSVSANSINYGENLVVNVTLPSDVQYRVNVSVGGMSKMVSLTNGVGSATFKGLSAGTYGIVATYGGDSKYDKSSATNTAKVKKISADIKIIANDIFLGDDLVVKLVLPSDVQYRVNVTAGGVSKMVSLTNGKGNTTFKGFGVGTYTVKATYGSDNNYVKSTASKSVKVNKLIPDIRINAKNVNYGEDLVVNVELPSDVQYRVNVSVGGTYKIVSLTNGVGSATFKGLSAGAYTISATYGGDGKYQKYTVNKTVRVNKILPDIVASAKTITYGEDLVVELQTSSDLTRRVIVTIEGESKPVSLNNGEGSATFKGLGAGTHTVFISYDGDENYLKSYTNFDVDVNKADLTIEIDVDDINYGELLEVNLEFPADVTQSCYIVIGAQLDYVYLDEGLGTIYFDGLYPGFHIVNVFYDGDSNYNSAFYYCMVFVYPD